jgi:hypothetical protein
MRRTFLRRPVRIGRIMKGQRIIVAGKVVVPRSKGPSWLALKRPDGKVG